MKVDFHYLLEFSYLFSRIYDNKTNFNLYYSFKVSQIIIRKVIMIITINQENTKQLPDKKEKLKTPKRNKIGYLKNPSVNMKSSKPFHNSIVS